MRGAKPTRRRLIAAAIIVLVSSVPVGGQLLGAEAPPRKLAEEPEVFSLEPMVVTAPWPITPPRYKDIRKPPYPEAARARGQEGTVLLGLLVRADGTVGEVKIEQSSGRHLFDAAAVEAARTWTFVPGRQGPRAIELWVRVPVKFELK